jgi:DNA-binding HxlR family transcriptional regulator
MGRRVYDQACSLACALDTVGERWSLLIVRELMLGSLRFSELGRSVGGAPTDVLSRRLRDLERSGVVRRRELSPPAAATVYELTELGRGLERPLLELSRWGMGLQRLEDVVDLAPTSLPGALRVILEPPPQAALTLSVRSGGQAYRLRMEGGWIAAQRGEAESPDLSLSGDPVDVIATLVIGEAVEEAVEIDGDRDVLTALREMVAIPSRLREEALEGLGGQLSSVPS